MPSHRSPCWRLSQPQTEIGWMSASQTSSVLGRRLRWLFTKEEPLPRISLSWYSFIGSYRRSPGNPPDLHDPDGRSLSSSIPAVTALLSRPERAEGTIFARGKVLDLFMRAAHVPLADHDRFDPVPGEELLDIPLDLRVRYHVGGHPPLEDRLGGRRRDHPGGDLGRGLVIGAVEGHGPDRVLPPPLRLPGGRVDGRAAQAFISPRLIDPFPVAAILELPPAAAGTRIIPGDSPTAHRSPPT